MINKNVKEMIKFLINRYIYVKYWNLVVYIYNILIYISIYIEFFIFVYFENGRMI